MDETSADSRRRAAPPTLSAGSATRSTPSWLPVLPALRTSMFTVGTFALLLVSSPLAAAHPVQAAPPVLAAQPVDTTQPVIAVQAAGGQQSAADHPGEVVELSTDGTTYSRSLSDLFGPVRLSPGDQVDGSFWVRNAGARPARLTLAVTDVEVPDEDTLQALTLTSGPAVRPGENVALAEVSQHATLSSGETLEPGESIMIVSTLALGDLRGQQGQDSTVDLTVRVTLSGSASDAAPEPTGAAPTPPAPPGPTDGSRLTSPTEGGLLPRTWGAPLASTGGVAGGLTVVAGGLLALGLILWLAARRRRDRDTAPDGPEAPSSAARELLP